VSPQPSSSEPPGSSGDEDPVPELVPASDSSPTSRSLFAVRTAAVLRSRLWLLAGAMIATIGLAIFSMVTLKRQADTFAEVPEAIDARKSVRLMVIDALAAESAQRGFLLTGNPQYLGDFYAWDPMASIEEMRRATHGLIGAELVELEAVLAGKHREMQSTIELYQAGEKAAAHAIISSDLGKSYMKRAQTVMNTLIDLEAERVDEMFQSALVISQVAMPLILGGTGLTVLALITGFLALRGTTRSLSSAAQKNSQQATRLEHATRELAVSLEVATQSNRALMLSNRDLDQFAYVASHDLKAPLRAISSLSTWIEEDLDDKVDEKARDHLRLLRSRVERMAALIEGILGYSRAGREVEVSEINMLELVEEVRGQLLPPPEISVKVLPGPWPTVTTQRVQLTQVWSNLLSNAMKHGVPAGGNVELGCGWQDGELCFWVRDDGPGIEPIYHHKIFDLFQRLVSRDQVEGAGIGLSIVRKLVDRNGGRIWVESAPGDGTTFKFTWSSHDPA
jgi:signal transduction histidine kinase